MRILLLDCPQSTYDLLRQRSFEVDRGSLGMCTRVREVPRPFYEYEAIFYCPTSEACMPLQVLGNLPPTEDRSRNCRNSDLPVHIKRECIFIVFLNEVTEQRSKQHSLYEPIPFMLPIVETSDRDLFPLSGEQEDLKLYRPLITPHAPGVAIKLPVKFKIDDSPVPAIELMEQGATFKTLLTNRNGDPLASVIEIEQGKVIMLLVHNCFCKLPVVK